MTELTSDQLRERLEAVIDPHTGHSLGDDGAVRGAVVEGGRAAVDLRLGYPAAGWREALTEKIRAAAGIDAVSVNLDWQVGQHAVQHGLSPLPGVRNVIAVASGKGGVGKSTIAANLALGLAVEGARVGVLDADIYGPSQPRMLGLSGQPETTGEKKILPLAAHGLQAMSLGLLVRADQAMIWRGPMATQALMQMFNDTAWRDLDYLIVDLPPGTGDVQLTLAQRIPVAGAVVVTTPQEVALDDVRRAVAMFGKVNVPVLGIVENMSTYICPHCGKEDAIFGRGGGESISDETGTTLLGQIPLNADLGRGTDQGRPVVATDPDGQVGQRFREIARMTAGRLAAQEMNKTVRMPKISISD